MLRTFECLRCLVNKVDLTKYSILGCRLTVRNARRASRRLLPKMMAELDSSLDRPRRARQYDIHDETEFDGGQLEQIETGLNEYDEEDFKQNQRKELAQKIFIKRKILERKYFKPPLVPNILSWSTKEQIRLLNKENPEEWTVDKLAESFPTSRESIIRILKSKYQPKNEAEIIKHDNRARKNLLALRSTLPSDQVNAARNLLSKTASEASSIMVKPEQFVPKMGVFEAIVKDYPVKDGSEKGLYNYASGRNIHQETRVANNLTTESIVRNLESNKHWNPRWQHKSSKREFETRGKRSDDKDRYHFAANKNVREKSWNHQQPSNYKTKDMDDDDEYHDHEAKETSPSRHGGIDHEVSMRKHDRRSRTMFSKEHDNDDVDSLDKNRVVYDENGEFLYRIP